MKHFFTVVLIFILSVVTYSQENKSKIITDKPSFTRTPIIIPTGYVQFESGIIFSKEKFENINPVIEKNRIGILGTSLRVGVNEQLEVRMGGEYLMETVKSGGNESSGKGLNAFSLSSKYKFYTSEDKKSNAAFLLEINLPFGSSDFKPEKAEPGGALSYSYEAENSFTYTANLGTRFQSADDLKLYYYSLHGGLAFLERFGAFIEHYSLFAKERIPKTYIGAGLSYRNKLNIKVDLHFGKEITQNSNAWFIGAGFAIRVPD